MLCQNALHFAQRPVDFKLLKGLHSTVLHADVTRMCACVDHAPILRHAASVLLTFQSATDRRLLYCGDAQQLRLRHAEEERARLHGASGRYGSLAIEELDL